MTLPSFYSEVCSEGSLSDGSDQLIEVRDRINGQAVIATLDLLPGSFHERRLDETSVAEIFSVVANVDCCEDLNDIFLGQEIHWYRDRDSNGNRILAWLGVITLARWTSEGVFIQARDMTSWWDARLAPSIDIDDDATSIVLALHEAAMEEDPVNNFNILARQAGEVIEFQSYALECRTTKELIDELADYVIDYTAYGSKVLVGPAEFFPELPYFLNDKDFEEPPVIEARGPQYGFATRVVAKGASDVATATASRDVISTYGLVEVALNFDHIKSFDDLQKAADSHLAIHSNPYYLNVSGGSPALKVGSPIPYFALIPGIRISIESTSSCKKLRLKMRLLSVRNNADGSVVIGLEPVGETTEFEERALV